MLQNLRTYFSTFLTKNYYYMFNKIITNILATALTRKDQSYQRAKVNAIHKVRNKHMYKHKM